MSQKPEAPRRATRGAAHSAARRTVMTALAALPALPALPASGATQAASSGDARQRQGATTLVAYFSRSGNTRVVAGIIRRARGADLFEIRPATPYPEDYEDTVEQARQESARGFEPALAATVSAMADYDTLFLGFPIWGQTVPPVIQSFVSAHDLAGKTVIPFVTHGGYGPGNSQSVLTRHAPKARWRDAFVLEMDQERRTIERVTGWLGGVPRT